MAITYLSMKEANIQPWAWGARMYVQVKEYRYNQTMFRLS